MFGQLLNIPYILVTLGLLAKLVNIVEAVVVSIAVLANM